MASKKEVVSSAGAIDIYLKEIEKNTKVIGKFSAKDESLLLLLKDKLRKNGNLKEGYFVKDIDGKVKGRPSFFQNYKEQRQLGLF